MIDSKWHINPTYGSFSCLDVRKIVLIVSFFVLLFSVFYSRGFNQNMYHFSNINLSHRWYSHRYYHTVIKVGPGRNGNKIVLQNSTEFPETGNFTIKCNLVWTPSTPFFCWGVLVSLQSITFSVFLSRSMACFRFSVISLPRIFDSLYIPSFKGDKTYC